MIGTLHPNTDLIVRDTGTVKGRGVFAGRTYVSGEIVEISPIMEIVVPWDDLPRAVQLVVYEWGYLCGDKRPNVRGVAFGVGSLFNHQDDPNLSYAADVSRQAMVYTARRDIAVGEELTIDYNADIDTSAQHPVDQAGDWFSIMGITRVG